jgi:S1-C subfamily serine protease
MLQYFPAICCSVHIRVLIVAFPLFLAACASDGGPGLELESRSIAVEQNAVPTSGAGASTSVSHLLPATGPTYVTLTVSRKVNSDSDNGGRSSSQAVTSGSGYLVNGSGYVMTAAHVALSKGNTVSARASNGRVYSGTVLAVQPDNDMAIIKLRGFSGKSVSPAAALPRVTSFTHSVSPIRREISRVSEHSRQSTLAVL